MYAKVENKRLIPAPANFVTPEGRAICNFNLSPALMEKYGVREWSAEELAAWHAENDPPVAPYVSGHCSKYQLVRALRERFPELLATLRQAYAADLELQFFWNTVAELDRENTDFQAAAEKLGVTSEQLDDIFAAVEEF